MYIKKGSDKRLWYPPQLPALMPAEKKTGVWPVINGCYADKGLGFSPKGKPLGEVSLTQLLHKSECHYKTNAHRVIIPGPEAGLTNVEVVLVIGPEKGVLELQSWQGQTKLATEVRREDKFATPDTYLGNRGFVWLALHSEAGGAAGIGMLATDESLWLRKAVDGSLIVLDREVAFGVLVIAPFGGTASKGYRFPPAE